MNRHRQPNHRSESLIYREAVVLANNYSPLPVVIERARDCLAWDAEGRQYIDFMSAYSAVSHGHLHPRLVAAATAQMQRVAVASRAFYSDTLAPFIEKLCAMTGLDRALPMNTGAEAVETAIKAARRWGYRHKRIAEGGAEILVARGNFHGRTTTLIGFSSEPDYQRDFGPFTPGFRLFDFGNMASLEAARSDRCCAVLVEPIQGEAGIVVPPDGYLRALRDWCDRHGLLLILDEVQSGLGRTGRHFAYQHEQIRPDGLVLGKALGGGLLPVSAFVATEALMQHFEPGSHGSTFGGNALAAAVGLEALRVVEDEQLAERSELLGRHLLERLRAIDSTLISQVRGRGLWAGVEIDATRAPARAIVERLAERGVLSKETHGTVIRFAPPLTITRALLDQGLDEFTATLAEFEPSRASRAWLAPLQQALPLRVQTLPPQPNLLMSPPDHFEVSYSINPWMNPRGWANDAERLTRNAREGWHRLRGTYQMLGAQVQVQPPADGLPDLVFTANAAVVLDRKALLSRFLPLERRGEEALDRQMFETLARRGLIDSIQTMPPGVYFEGAGDALWDPVRQQFWLGYGQRSSLEARDTIRAVFNVPTVSLRLIDPRFYHLDTCLCLLSGGEVLFYPDAFDTQGLAVLEALAGDRLIAASHIDAARLGVNSVCLGTNVVMGYCSEELRSALEARGYHVHQVDLGAFNQSGGSSYCLTLRLDHRSASAPLGTALPLAA